MQTPTHDFKITLVDVVDVLAGFVGEFPFQSESRMVLKREVIAAWLDA